MKLQFRQQWWPNQLLFRCLCYCPGILNTCLRLCAFFLCKMLPPDQRLLSNDALMLSSHPYANQLSGKPGMYILAFKVKCSRDFTVAFWREQMVIISRSLGKYRQRIEYCLQASLSFYHPGVIKLYITFNPLYLSMCSMHQKPYKTSLCNQVPSHFLQLNDDKAELIAFGSIKILTWSLSTYV